MIKEFDDNVFSCLLDGKTVTFRHECVMCGNCCKNNYDIYIDEEDIRNWQKLERSELLKYIQIDPTCISPSYIDFYSKILQRYGRKTNTLMSSTDDILHLSQEITDLDEEKHLKRISKLKQFILNTHEYLGEGLKDIYIPHDLLPGYGYHAIMSPKTFKTIKTGWRKGLRYKLIMEPNDSCDFLQNNRCSIHEHKPRACENYPSSFKVIHNTEKYQLKMKKALLICKGFTKEELKDTK